MGCRLSLNRMHKNCHERSNEGLLTGSDCLGRSMYDDPSTSALADKESRGAGGVKEGISTMTGVC